MTEYLITAIVEGGDRAYFMGLMPNGDASWTTQRGLATGFRVLSAALDTAAAVKLGEVVGRHNGAAYPAPTGTTATATPGRETEPDRA